jgi:hypothetical protein
MPYSGQDKYGSVSRKTRERTVERMQEIRSGRWNQVPPDKTPAARNMELRRRTKERISDPGYFGNQNALKRQQEINQRSIQGFMERLSRVNEG